MEYFSDSNLLYLWWAGLSFTSLLNILFYFKLFFIYENSDINKNSYFKYQRILCGIYVLVCAFRSIFPRIDVERICVWDIWLSSPALGRTLATIAEMSFILQISLFIGKYLNHYYEEGCFSYRLNIYCGILIFVLISIAEVFSWTGVITLNQIFNCIEESLWLVSVFIALISLINFLPRLNKLEQKPGLLKIFLILFIVFGSLFVLYIFFVDVPMYFKRWSKSNSDNIEYLGIKEGFKDAIKCKVISKSFLIWKEDILWMTPYFTLAVWGSILLGKIELPAEKKVKNE